jgi:signal transduction histidine kinase
MARLYARPNMPLLRGLNIFWLVSIGAILIGGNADAISRDASTWHSWRGPVMGLLSVAFLGWYLLIVLGYFHARYGWPLPRRIMYAWLASGFAIATALIAFDNSFASLAFALIGSSLFMPARREAIVPVTVAILLCAWGWGLAPSSGHVSFSGDTFSRIFNVATSVAIVYVIARLIRERIHSENLLVTLREANERLRLAAAREAEMATLEERNRLAREMHDSLGHALVSIAIKLEAARRLGAVDAERAARELSETTSLVRATMTDLRHSLAGLRPPALDERPLRDALVRLTEDSGRQAGIEATAMIDPAADTLDRCRQETLYRVGQEALTNVTKHAHACSVTLSVVLENGVATLEVADDGVGLCGALQPGTRQFGVKGMRERVEALGGAFTLRARPSGGTVLTARIPLAM